MCTIYVALPNNQQLVPVFLDFHSLPVATSESPLVAGGSRPVPDMFISSIPRQSASAMVMPRAAILTGRRGVSPDSAAEACATVCTTRKGGNVRSARPASTGILDGRARPPTPANVSPQACRVTKPNAEHRVMVSCLGLLATPVM